MYGLYAVIHGKSPALIGKGKEDAMVQRSLSLTLVTPPVDSEFWSAVRALVVRELNTDELVFSVII